MATVKKPKYPKKLRDYFGYCGRKARGVKKTYTADEIALRTARLDDARKKRWPAKRQKPASRIQKAEARTTNH